MDIREEFEFTLPLGYKDKDGIIHKTGVMRRSRAKDEIVLLQDMRVQRNRAYLIIALLGRVVSQLGTLNDVNTGVIENLFASDLRFLEDTLCSPLTDFCGPFDEALWTRPWVLGEARAREHAGTPYTGLGSWSLGGRGYLGRPGRGNTREHCTLDWENGHLEAVDPFGNSFMHR